MRQFNNNLDPLVKQGFSQNDANLSLFISTCKIVDSYTWLFLCRFLIISEVSFSQIKVKVQQKKSSNTPKSCAQPAASLVSLSCWCTILSVYLKRFFQTSCLLLAFKLISRFLPQKTYRVCWKYVINIWLFCKCRMWSGLYSGCPHGAKPVNIL